MRTVRLLILLMPLIMINMGAGAQSCRTVQPIGAPPHTAEDYPLPLSLRINLILLMKRELAARGRYNDPETVSDSVFHLLLENEIKRLQSEQGAPQTGCITWDLVMALDRDGRTPPLEALEAFE